jgi:hypothetical protein
VIERAGGHEGVEVPVELETTRERAGLPNGTQSGTESGLPASFYL